MYKISSLLFLCSICFAQYAPYLKEKTKEEVLIIGTLATLFGISIGLIYVVKWIIRKLNSF